MISNKDAEEILKHEYHLDNFTYLVKELLLPDFTSSKHDVHFNNEIFQSVTQLGESSVCDLTVFEVYLNEGTQNKRVTITQEMFKILRSLRIDNAIVSFVNQDKNNYRISLLTSKYEYDGDKIVRILSNPRRFSYSLGFGTKTKTAYKYLISKGKVNSLEELTERFSVEVVNKQFYNEIALCYTKLVGGERDGKKFDKQLGLYSVIDQKKYAEFAVRLIGRITFCWFLKEKKSAKGISLIPEGLLSIDTINNQDNYYHKTLEPLFFELLNTSQNRRKDNYQEKPFTQIPYLNGGLFSPHHDDMYEYDRMTGYGRYGLVNIPNEWFLEFYGILSQYNFTVDENTSYDIELSIDPEMLGRIFENLLAEINPETGENAKKSTGSFYTPRDIVDYMVDSSLCEYLKNKTNIDEVRLKALISYGKEDDSIATFDLTEKKKIINALYTITVLDPACGSGAFPIGMLQKIVYILQEIDPDAKLWFDKATEKVGILIKKEFEKEFNTGSLNYIRKLTVIQNSIFGIDIQPIAVEISRLRCFLSLVIEGNVNDEEYNRGIKPLPNLDFKFIIANTLFKLEDDAQMSLFENQMQMDRLKRVREEYFAVNDAADKKDLMLKFQSIQNEMVMDTFSKGYFSSNKYQQLFSWKPFENELTSWFDPDWMFGITDGFDVVIGNPPYISTKGVSGKDKELYEKFFGFSDDTYNLFTFKGLSLVKPNGSVNFIVPKTFWTTQTKRNMRDLLLNNTLTYIFDTADPFDTAMVDTCIFQVVKKPFNNNNILFLDGSENLHNPTTWIVPQNIYRNVQNSVIFKPNELNMKIYNLYGQKVKELYDKWWDKIKTSKDIEKNKVELEKYRNDLKPGDIALLGCLTEGGQGLATANNGKYIAVRLSTKWAQNIINSRPKKLEAVLKNYKLSMKDISNYYSVEEYFNNASEKDIAALFDKLKEKYGRDIFGQGYIYKLISDDEMANIDRLTDEEKENGIDSSKNHYVPYDKGDKDGNRWFLETPFAIAWSKENVRLLKTDEKARWQGYQFFFKEGFSWNLINGTRSSNDLKFRFAQASVNDVGGMTLHALCNKVSSKYIVCIGNSDFVSRYTESYINFTVNFQVNDCRLIPLIIPNETELQYFTELYNKAEKIRKNINNLSGNAQVAELEKLQKELNYAVNKLYKL